ncbi:MAG: hypothetical protein ACKVJ1_12925, partial [Verrucomicrobiia bacterium]
MNQYQTRRKSLDTAMRHLYRNGIANIITSKKRSKTHGKSPRKTHQLEARNPQLVQKDGKPLKENEHNKESRCSGRKTYANAGTLNEGRGYLYA